MGIDKLQPELSWKINEELTAQRDWRVQVSKRDKVIFDSGIVAGMGRKCILKETLE